MTFAAPDWLWALLLVPAFAFAALRHARALKPEETGGARWLWVDGASVRAAGGAAGRRPFGIWACVGLVLGIVALAEPQWGEGEVVRFDQGREVLIALDLSRSMLAEDVPPSRLDRARLLIESTLDGLRGERVGLLLFAGTAFLQSPLSADHEVLRELLPVLEPGYLPQGGTDFKAMITAALEAFSQTGAADRFLVILSDGESPNFESADVEALVEAGVRVVALGIGTAEGALIPDGRGGIVKDARGAAVLSRLERPVLEGLAKGTNGVYADAANWVDLAALVERTVSSGQAGQFVEERAQSRIHRFQWWLAPALLLLLMSHLREMPSAPRSRRLHDRSNEGAASDIVARAAGVLLVIGLGLGMPSRALSATSAIPEEGAGAPPDPLVAMVEQLSAAPHLGTPEYAEFARFTAEAGFDRRDAGTPLPDGAVHDALAAVELGRSLDADAAAWDDLRRALESLVEAPPPSQQSQEQEGEGEGQDESEDGEAGEQAQSQSAEGDDSSENEAGEGSEGQPPDATDSEGEPSGSDSSGSPSEDDPSDGETASSGSDDSEPSEDESGGTGERPEGDPQAMADASAGFGDLDETESDEGAGDSSEDADGQDEDASRDAAENRPAPPSRMVGGAPTANEELIQARPDLASAIGRMERVREGDAPALLFDRMNQAEGQTERSDAAGGQDW